LSALNFEEPKEIEISRQAAAVCAKASLRQEGKQFILNNLFLAHLAALRENILFTEINDSINRLIYG
jgi:hypothetical protein